MKMASNALVIDVEHWYSNDFLLEYLPDEKADQVVEATIPILNLLKKYNVHATFAILGTVAEKHPDLVKEIFDQGHEIASHAFSHKSLHLLTKDEFEKEIKESVTLLKSITGESPIGFRAPSFSIDNSTIWAFEVLEKYGFKYDASVFPIKTMIYGVPNAPLNIYRPEKSDIARHDPDGKIIEFPMTVINMGINFPISGGFYLRLLPLWFLKFGYSNISKKRPTILYLHPWETYLDTPRLKIPALSKFEAYYGINSSMNKFEELLKTIRFSSIKQVLQNLGYLSDQEKPVYAEFYR